MIAGRRVPLFSLFSLLFSSLACCPLAVKGFVGDFHRGSSAEVALLRRSRSLGKLTYSLNNDDINGNNNNDKNDDDRHFSSPSPLSSSRVIQTYKSTQEMLQAIQDPRRYTIVLFHAAYCKMCQLSLIQYNRAAFQYEPSKLFKFGKIETSHMTKDQLQRLGIMKFPYCQIYDTHGRLIASFGNTPNKTPKLNIQLQQSISAIQRRSKVEWDYFFLQYAKDIRQNKAAQSWLQLQPEIAPGPIQTWSNTQQFVTGTNSLSLSSSKNSIQVILVHSHFVPACERSHYQFRRISEKFAKYNNNNKNQNIQFAKIEVDAMEDELGIVKKLKITDFPTILIYHNGKCVASVATGPSYMFNKVITALLNKFLKCNNPQDWEQIYMEQDGLVQSSLTIQAQYAAANNGQMTQQQQQHHDDWWSQLQEGSFE